MAGKNQINRRQFCKTAARSSLAVGMFGLSAAMKSSTDITAPKKRGPNIVLIFSDDQGIGDVSLYGGDIATPNIDGIGKDGIKFNNFYVALPVCTPSRYSLLTGRYPYRAPEPYQGALLPKDPAHSRLHLPKDEVTVGRMLQDAGYKTALIGKWHLAHGSIEFGPNSYGFDKFYGFLPGCIDFYKHSYEATPNWYRDKQQVEEEGFATDLFTDEAIKFIDDNKDRPFFLYLPYNAPHYGRCADGKLLQSPPEYPDLPRKSKDDRRVYAAMVENMDKNIGRVLDTLKKLNLERDTAVIFLSDNGADPRYGGSNEPYRGTKGTLWEGGIKTPCVIRWTGQIASGQQRDQVCISTDWFKTVANWAGAKLPDRALDGIDLNNVIFKNSRGAQRSLYFYRKAKKQEAVRTDKWKYIKDTDGTEYLFDMTKDPYEKNNVIGQNRQQADKMKAQYDAFMNGL